MPEVKNHSSRWGIKGSLWKQKI